MLTSKNNRRNERTNLPTALSQEIISVDPKMSQAPGSRLLGVLALCALMPICGCTSNIALDNGLIRRLNNRGPVVLSPNNPYIAGNLLLSKEMEKSNELRGFVKHRGAPAALEVQKSTFSPLVMKLYYPENAELFDAEQTDDGGWMIKGPEKLNPGEIEKILENTKPIDDGGKEIPLVEPAAQTHESAAPDETLESKLEVTAAPTELGHAAVEPRHTGEKPTGHKPALQPKKPEPQVVAKKPVAVKKPDVEEPAGTSGAEPSEEDAQSQAELTPKGDLVHYVTYPGESLEIISRWYTKDAANAGKIARMNKLSSSSSSLTIGDSIVIPSYMLKNTTRLAEKDIPHLAGSKDHSAPKDPPAPKFTGDAEEESSGE